jgi:hypothetical protein
MVEEERHTTRIGKLKWEENKDNLENKNKNKNKQYMKKNFKNGIQKEKKDKTK